MEAVLVAKAEDSTPSRRPGPKPNPEKTKSVSINMRSTPAWKEWADGLVEFSRAGSFGNLVDRAFIEVARQIGYDRMPPKR